MAISDHIQGIIETLDQIDVALVIFDANDALVYCNENYNKLNEDIRQILIPGVDYRQVCEAAKHYRTLNGHTGEAWVVERYKQFRHPGEPTEERHANGRWFQLKEWRTPQDYYIGVRTDITLQKQAEALESSEHRFRDFAEVGTDWLWELDDDLRFTYLSNSFEPNFGWPDSKSLGRKKADIYAPIIRDGTAEEKENWRRHFEDLDARRPFRNFVQRWITDSGKTIYISNSGKPLFDPSGAFTGYRGVASNITQRIEAEATTRTSEARMASILDIAPEAIIVLDDSLNIQIFNQGAEDIFGYRTDEILGQSLNVLIPTRFHEVHSTHIEWFKNSPDSRRTMDKRRSISGLRKDGNEFPAFASVSKLETGGQRLFTVVLQDFTDRLQSEEDLREALVDAERANQAKSEFLATMSHELRTPLNAITGFSEMIAGEFFGPHGSPKYGEYAKDIGASSAHLLSLINDILDLSAIEAGKQSLTMESIHITSILDDCEHIVAVSAQRKGVTYKVEIPDDLPPLLADRRAFKQILLNVLNNAIKFTPGGGHILLTASIVADRHVLKICDTGIGIKPEVLAHIPEPFMRGNSNPYTAQEGTGLGLAIVKSLMALHDGELDIESELDHGTEVTLTFPRITTDPAE